MKGPHQPLGSEEQPWFGSSAFAGGESNYIAQLEVEFMSMTVLQCFTIHV